MTDASRDQLIALSLLPFLTPARIRLLREWFEPLSSVGSASTAILEGLLNIPREQAEVVKHPLRHLRNRVPMLRDSVTTLLDDDYPPLLREIADPPLVLHFRGDLSLLRRPAVAVVGSRRASPYATNAAEHLARQLVSAGVTIVSGLARGVDSAAHAAALDAGGGTIAILGTGIDIVYPRSNKRLFRLIEERGLILTEFPPGTPPLPSNFPVRNRVISGISLGTVIVEATSRSGSLITARTAAEQNREVGAVPGPIFSPGSEGTHRLIQYGAKLVHDANDILEELRGDFRVPQSAPPPAPDSPLAEVLEVFRKEEATHIDAATERLRRPIASVSEAVLQLELGGWLRALPGARWVRVR
jgi:DNA processing protein